MNVGLVKRQELKMPGEKNNLDQFLEDRQKRKLSLTLVTGVFDLLHQEHLNFLQAAKKTADLLIVGLESDRRVKEIKGPDRPINEQNRRLANLAEKGIADLVFILPEDFKSSSAHEALIDKIRPDNLAVSAHTSFIAEKRRIMNKFTGKLIVVHEHNPNYSSTRLLRKKKMKEKNES